MNNEPPKIITLNDDEFDAFVDACKNATWPNEALRKAADGRFTDLDPNDPDYFKKRIKEKERKRKLLDSLPPESLEELLRRGKERAKRKHIRLIERAQDRPQERPVGLARFVMECLLKDNETKNS